MSRSCITAIITVVFPIARGDGIRIAYTSKTSNTVETRVATFFPVFVVAAFFGRWELRPMKEVIAVCVRRHVALSLLGVEYHQHFTDA